VEKVLKMHVKKEKEEFPVKGVGYLLGQATWEPIDQFSGE
jgi:hypothetical protein